MTLLITVSFGPISIWVTDEPRRHIRNIGRDITLLLSIDGAGCRPNYTPLAIIETQRRGEVANDLIRHLAHCAHGMPRPIVDSHLFRCARTLPIA